MTIIYTEKGYGLHDAIAAAGHWLEQRDGTWVSSDDVAVQAIIEAYTLDHARAYTCARVIDKSSEYFARATANVTPAEMAGWPILRAEAIAYNADNTAPCPAMTEEARSRGCTIAELAAKVTVNTQRFDALRAAIAGNSGSHRDAINALATFADVVAYDYSGGWPQV